MSDIQVTQDQAIVIAIVGVIGIAAVIALIFGSGVFSRVPGAPPEAPPRPAPTSSGSGEQGPVSVEAEDPLAIPPEVTSGPH